MVFRNIYRLHRKRLGMNATETPKHTIELITNNAYW